MHDLKENIDSVAKEIAQSGIDTVFGIPGGGASLDLIDKLSQFGIRFITTHSEASAAIMAGILGRLSGVTGVSVSIKGPGLANMLPGLTACHFENLPMVALSESSPPSDLAGGHKWLDHASLVKSVTKGCRYLGGVGQDYLQASELALRETPGPVLLNLAYSSQGSEEIESVKNTDYDEGRSEALRLIEASQKPVVIAGSLAVRQQWSNELNQLNCPVFTTASAKGLVDEHLQHAAGVFTGMGLQLAPESAIIPEADLVIGLGLKNDEVLVGEPFHCGSINITTKGINESSFHFHAVGPIELSTQVFSALAEKTWGIEQSKKARHKLTAKLQQSRFLPANVFHTFAEYFGEQVRLVLDTGNFCTIGEHVWRASLPNYFLCSGNGRSMGTAVPMAIGAAFFDRTTPTVVVCGDGGIGMHLTEIKIAVEYNLPLLIVLLTDGGFASVLQSAVHRGLDEKSLKVRSPSWLRAISGMGVIGTSANSLPQLEKGLAEWQPEKGPYYLECSFDSAEYLNMTSGLRA